MYSQRECRHKVISTMFLEKKRAARRIWTVNLVRRRQDGKKKKEKEIEIKKKESLKGSSEGDNV